MQDKSIKMLSSKVALFRILEYDERRIIPVLGERIRDAMNAASLKKFIAQGSFDQSLTLLYGQEQLEAQRLPMSIMF